MTAVVAPMTIGFDVSPLAGPRTGIGRYTFELLGALSALGDARIGAILPIGHRPVVALPAEAGRPRIEGPSFPFRAPWTLGLLPLWLRGAGIDVFHATSYYAPPQGRVPTVVTVHDLSVFETPEFHPRARVLRAHALMPAAARQAAAVLVPSAAVQAGVVRWLGVAPGRVHVVPEAPAAAFSCAPGPEAVAGVLAGHGLQPGFFLSIGTLEPRKNLARVVEAVELLRSLGDDPQLVVAGPPGWKFDPVVALIRRYRLTDRVRFLGFVPDAELVALMAAAAGLVYPSLHEGFGLPVLEAMAAGLPVVTSDGGALAEVAGDAALLVDPLSPDAIAGAMRLLCDDGALRARLAAAGRARAGHYSWARTAAETLAVYAAATNRSAAAA